MTDLEIAHATPLLPIRDVAAQIGIDENDLEQHGKYIAKSAPAPHRRNVKRTKVASSS